MGKNRINLFFCIIEYFFFCFHFSPLNSFCWRSNRSFHFWYLSAQASHAHSQVNSSGSATLPSLLIGARPKPDGKSLMLHFSCANRAQEPNQVIAPRSAIGHATQSGKNSNAAPTTNGVKSMYIYALSFLFIASYSLQMLQSFAQCHDQMVLWI